MPYTFRVKDFFFLPLAKPNVCYAGVFYFMTTDFHMRKGLCLAPSLAAVFKTGERDFKYTPKFRGPFCYAPDFRVKGLSIEGSISHH